MKQSIHIVPPGDLVRMPRQHRFNMLLLDICMASPCDWKYSQNLHAYSIRTDNGTAFARGVTEASELKRWLSELGAYGLQALCAVVDEHVQDRLSKAVAFNGPPGTLILRPSRYLQAMRRKNQGKNGGYSRGEQDKLTQTLVALSRIDIHSFRHSGDGKSDKKICQVGPLLAVTRQEEPSGSLIHLRLSPKFWALVAESVDWLPARLLSLHPQRQKYELAAGFYLCSLMLVRRNKTGQDNVSVGVIERCGRLGGLDTNEHRRLPRLMRALDNLVEMGIIGGSREGSSGSGAPVTAKDYIRRHSLLHVYRNSNLKLAAPATGGINDAGEDKAAA